MTDKALPLNTSPLDKTSPEDTLLFTLLTGVGLATYWKVIDRFGELSTAFTADPQQLKELLPSAAYGEYLRYRQLGQSSEIAERVSAVLDVCRQCQIQLIHRGHADYPELLYQLTKAPPILYLKGEVNCLHLPQIAVVGSRRPSPTGRQNASGFAKYLAASGFVVTSGLAQGVDAAAHQGALAGAGKTLAVMGTGVDVIYPRSNTVLADQILDSGGALLSEFPLGATPRKHHFPQRNRIISGLSYGTLVVEAAIRSGSLITARQALEQDREVFAIPGSIHNPLSRGCHALIKQGATLVETAEDIVDELTGFVALKRERLMSAKVGHDPSPSDCYPTEQSTDLSETECKILEHLGYDPCSVDALIERSGIAVGVLLSLLTELELKGHLANTATGYLRMIK